MPLVEEDSAAMMPGADTYGRDIGCEPPLRAQRPAEPTKAWDVKRSAMITTGANATVSVLSVFTGVMAARLLGPKGRGELAAIQAWPSVLASLAMLGAPDAMLYYCAREPLKRNSYFSAALLIGTAGALFFSVAGFIAMPWLLSLQSAAVVWGARVFLFQIWMYLLIAMPAEALRAMGRFTPWNFVRICPMVLWVGIFAAAWVGGRRAAVPIASAYIALGWLILLPVVRFLRVDGFRLILPRWREVQDTLKFGLPVVGTFMPRVLNLRLDQILMAGLLPPAVLGQYVVGVAWSNAGAPLMHGVSAVIVPKLAVRNGYGPGGPGSELARATRIGVVLAALTAVGLLALASAGIRIFFGARFAPAIPAARLLAVAGGVAGLNSILSEGMRGLGRPGAVLRAELAAFAITAAGLWLLLRPMGIYGAALVSLVAYAITTGWLLAEALSVTRVPITDFLIPRRRDLALLLQTGRGAAAGGLSALAIASATFAHVLRGRTA